VRSRAARAEATAQATDVADVVAIVGVGEGKAADVVAGGRRTGARARWLACDVVADRARLGLWLFPDVAAPELLDALETLDAGGLDEFWLGDEGPAREPFALLAAASARTRRLGLGVAVTNPYVRHPAIGAAAALTIDELAPGRVRLGIGPGGGMALGPLGLTRQHPVADVRRALRLSRAVLQGEPTAGYAPPYGAPTAPGLALYVGARGERLNRLASELADGVFLGGIPRAMLPRTIEWARSLRPVRVALYPAVAFDEEAAEHLRPSMVYAYLDAPEETRAREGLRREELAEAALAIHAGDDGAARRLIDDDRLDQLVLRGRPERVAAQLLALGRGHGADEVGLALTTRDLGADVDSVLATVEAVARLS
jgi:5,10-methylenetetrahydromethanopterin reductase